MYKDVDSISDTAKHRKFFTLMMQNIMSAATIPHATRLERAMKDDPQFLSHVEDLTVLMRRNAMELADEDKQRDELEGLLRICLMVKNALGWPVSGGGVGNMTREASMDYYKSIFGQVRTDTPLEVEIEPLSEMSNFVLDRMKKIAFARYIEERAVVSRELEQKLRTTPSFMTYVEQLSVVAEGALLADTTMQPQDVMGELLLGLAVKNAKGWPAAVGTEEARARISEMKTYTTVLGTPPSDIGVGAGRLSSTGEVKYGTVCIRGASVLAVPSNTTCNAAPSPADSNTTSPPVDSSTTSSSCDYAQDTAAKNASEARFDRAVARREARHRARNVGGMWRGPVAYEEDMLPPEECMPLLEEGMPLCEHVARGGVHLGVDADSQVNWEFVFETPRDMEYIPWSTPGASRPYVSRQ
ncbi:hypothetical protein T484DRAFT_1854829 [Baffinella frigidus]|nr:hypothetical protein T484DRAFT_1854829 [Cryptophyta sp. CCMP2293]